MTIYDKHLRRLGVIIIALRAFLLSLEIFNIAVLHVTDGATLLPILLGETAVSLVSASIAFISAKRKDLVRFTIAGSVALMIAMVVLLVMNGSNADSVVDLTLLLIGLVFFIQIQIRKRFKVSRALKKRPTNTLDLRISGQGDLFNPLVMGPHLEPNQDIVGVIDHFLDTAVTAAPLNLCFHTAQPVSPVIRETLAEVLRLHYHDEVKRVERFMESRYIRYVVLIILSVAVLRVLIYFQAQSNESVLWMIFSNFAAFSLWQVGSTYFERVQAFERLTWLYIAQESRITFY